MYEGNYSPAVYQMANLPLGTPIDTKEKKKKVREAIYALDKEFETLSKKRSDCNYHYQRYVNCYESFRKESANPPWGKVFTSTDLSLEFEFGV